MDDDLDLHLRALVGSFRLDLPPEDRRAGVAIAVRRRRWRRRAGSRAAVALMLGLGIGASMARPQDDRIAVGPRGLSTERATDVPGLPDPIRISEGLDPLPGMELYGAVPLGGGAVTGATQTRLDTGEVVVLVAITPGPTIDRVELSGEGVVAPLRARVDGPSLLVVRLTERSPHLVLTFAALDAAGEVTGQARITPFVQDPLDCGTEAEVVGSADPAPPTYVRHLDAYLAAPLLAACDG